MASRPPGPLECMPEYLRLISRPMWSPTMANVWVQEDWTDFVSRWNVVGVALVAVSAVACYGVVVLVMVLTIVGILFIPWAILAFVKQIAEIFFWGFLGWYCLVKRNACCGNIGYLLFAIFYGLSPVVQISQLVESPMRQPGQADEEDYMETITLMIGLIMSVPSLAIAYGCIRLFISEPQARAVTVLSGGVHPSAPAASASPWASPAQAFAPPAPAAMAPTPARPMQAMAPAQEMAAPPAMGAAPGQEV